MKREKSFPHISTHEVLDGIEKSDYSWLKVDLSEINDEDYLSWEKRGVIRLYSMALIYQVHNNVRGAHLAKEQAIPTFGVFGNFDRPEYKSQDIEECLKKYRELAVSQELPPWFVTLSEKAAYILANPKKHYKRLPKRARE